jgi:hypothetical protein
LTLFETLNSSLSRINIIWKFKTKNMLETRRNFENRLCSRNTMHKRDIMVWVWNSAMYKTFDVKVTLPNAWRD